MKTGDWLCAGILMVAMLTGCAGGGYSRPTDPNVYYGVVNSIDVVEPGDSGVTGAVIGGVVGGVLGNQVGGGHGNTAATIAGAAGGAVVGNQIEKRRQQNARYRIGVRMDDGSIHTYTQDDGADLRVGSRVRVENNHVYRY